MTVRVHRGRLLRRHGADGLSGFACRGACTCIAHTQHSHAGAQTHRVCQSDALESALTTREGAHARHPRAAQETPVGRWAERAADRFEECTVVQGDLVGARVRSKAWPEASALAERWLENGDSRSLTNMSIALH